MNNKPGTAQVGAISKAQKQQKDFKVLMYSLLQHPRKPKVGPNWRAFDIFHPFCRKSPTKLKGDHLEKISSKKKSHNAQKNLKAAL